MVSPFSDEPDGAVVTVSPRMVLQRGWSVEEAIYLRTRVLQPVIRTKSWRKPSMKVEEPLLR